MPNQAQLFDGVTYEPEHDEGRLFPQLQAVVAVIADGHWRTLEEIADLVGYPQASISARLRDCRKDRWGARLVDRRRRGDTDRGLFEYRLVPVEEQRMRETEEESHVLPSA